MLTNEQLSQLETRLLERLHGEDGDLAVLLAHVDHLTTHNRVMQAALAQLSDKENWDYDKSYDSYEWLIASISPIELAERALVGDGGLSHDAS